ncbi:MAG: uridine kinase [Oscillospiraceae bacterium]|nr:uridine kinase [Oscillospiraceae bacterium]
MRSLAIGIAGGTGSGKTTLTERIVAQFGEDVSVLHHDSYYKAHDEMPFEERCRLNYDHPDAFDTPLFVEHLRALRRGEAVECPVYDYSVHNRAAGTVRLPPARVLVVEGILIFAEPEVVRELDIKIFVDTDADERILRRIVRDVRDRGRSLESVIAQYLTTVKPMHEQFVEPSKRRADLIVPEGGHNAVALEMVIERIRAYLNNEP